MPSDSPLASGRPVAANELQEQNFVSYPPESAVYRTVSEMCRRAGFQLRIAQVTHETSTMLSALLGNFLNLVMDVTDHD